MTPLEFASARELIQQIRTGEISPVEVMEQTLRRVDAVNPILNAFTNLYPEQALDQAKKLAQDLVSGKSAGPLAGLPIGVKDLEDVAGMATTYGSLAFQNHIAGYDSTQVSRLKAAGAIVIGKTNTPEFGFTGFTKNRLFGTTRNPWNPSRTPGGSSGGSAAAVAGGMVAMATGSDAGGSIRIPSSYSGCFGLKTSAGRIPWGPVPLLYMDTISVMGPIARSVEDAALFLDCTAGYHPSDPRSLPKPGISYVQCLEDLPKGLKIAFSQDLGYAVVQKEVLNNVRTAVACFEDMGHFVDVPQVDFFDPSEGWSLFMNLDIYAQYNEYIGKHKELVSRSLIKTLETYDSLSIADIIQADVVRTEFNRVLWKLFDRYDLLLTPTMPTDAFAAEGPPPSEVDGKPIDLLGAVAFTYPFNLSGHPAASVPAGFTDAGLPVGLQIVGPRHRDDLVLQAARAYERMRPWNDHWPKIA
jgi:aspartyl-tRNA(Asn)/glutamyl-tRNA(Gln) amidotransferase subunit A